MKSTDRRIDIDLISLASPPLDGNDLAGDLVDVKPVKERIDFVPCAVRLIDYCLHTAREVKQGSENNNRANDSK